MIISLLLLFVMVLSVSATFAADEDATLTEVDDEVTIYQDVLSVQEDNDQLSVEEEDVVEADDSFDDVLKEDNVVTNNTFHNYFDDSGSLLDTVTAEELIFEGDFSEIDVNYISIDRAIKFTGKNAVFNGVSFEISSDDVEIKGFDLTGSDYALFAISEVSDVTISDCKINFAAIEGYDSYAIYAFAVDNLKIINNNITYVGCTDGTSINNAIRIEGDEEEELSSDNIVIQKNNFDITLPSVAIKHPDMYSMANTEIFSSGIDLIYCCDVNITDNEMEIKYNDHYGNVDTIYGISVRGNPMNFFSDDPIVSENILIKNNVIKATGYNYIYSILIAGNNFEVSDNQLTISADNYYANGIEVEGPSETGIVKNNTISIKAPGATYGIISGVLQMGAIEDVSYVNNTIDTESYFACGIELSQWTSEIINNYITVKGNYTVGICDSAKNGESTISKNTINCLGTNVGDEPTGDTILGKESIAIAVLGDVTIEDNNVSSTNVGIEAVEEGAVVIKNNDIKVDSNNGKMDNFAIVVNDIDELTIIGNDVVFSGLVDDQFVIIGYDDWGYPIYDSSNNTRSYGVYVKDSNAVIKDNKFDISIPTFANNWGATRETFSEGIVLTGCDDVVFEGNDVLVTANGGNSWDSIYGLEVWNSANPTVKNNNITLNGAGYAYAIIINDENFVIDENKIEVTSEVYACGIDVEGTANGNITGNTISAISSTSDGSSSAYPVYSGMNYMPVTVDIKDNTIKGESYYVVGIEVGGDKALIENNQIEVNGNHTVGVGSTVSTLTVNNNNIVASASNEGNATIYDYIGEDNAGIKVNSGDAVITSNNISSNQMGINVASACNKVNIESNNINVDANSGKRDNFAIVAKDIEDLTIIGNDVVFSGLVDDQFVIIGYDDWGYPIYDSSNNTRSYGVYVKDSNAVIKDNKFDISIPTFANNWGATRETFSEGIVLTGCDDVVFEGNDVLVTANVGNSWDSIYGLEVWNSANPTVKNNNITLDGDGYAYAIIINDENFVIDENKIEVTSEVYACGIDVEGTANGVISNNNIDAVATDSAYPIYSGMNFMPVSVEITDNNISGAAYYAVGIELGGDKALIENNKIEVGGNHTIGIGSDVDDLTVNNNVIVSDASNIGDTKIWDSMGADTTGIKVAKGNATISNNNVKTTGDYAADLCNNNATLTDNYLASKKGAGAGAVANATNAVITGSTPELKTVLTAVDLYTVYNAGDMLYVTAVDENGDPIKNATIFLTYEADMLNATTDDKGVAAFFIDEWDVGDYLVDIKYNGNDTYGPKAIKTLISVEKAVSTIVAPKSVSVFLTAVKKGSYYTITLKDDKDNGLAGEDVAITFNGKTKTYTTNGLGVIKFKLSATKAGTQKLTVKFNSNDNYVASTLTATVKINKEATKLTAKKKTFKAKKKTKKYAVTLKDSKGKAIKKVKVTIKVGKKTFKAKTNAKGKATFKIKKLNKKGTYKAKVKFAGNALYKAVTKTVKIKVKK